MGFNEEGNHDHKKLKYYCEATRTMLVDGGTLNRRKKALINRRILRYIFLELRKREDDLISSGPFFRSFYLSNADIEFTKTRKIDEWVISLWRFSLAKNEMQLPITVWSREPWYRKRLSHLKGIVIEVERDDTVADVASKLSARLGILNSNFLFILCGNKLTSDTPISALFLGPQTSLTAVITERCSSDEDGKQETESSSSATNNRLSEIASFKVFCKKCNSLKDGKLRVYCAECSSGSLILNREPNGWNDVLQINAIKADCKDCERETAAHFCFKCIDCGQVAVPLTHVRNFRSADTCSICYDSRMKLNCNHHTCLECFSTYIKTAFTEHQFAFFPPNGYTVSCPVYGCRGCVVDTHCFYLLGKANYDEYQRQAAERFVTLEEEGVFCPKANCGACFLWEFDPSYPKITCPECHFSFCGLCRQMECACLEADATKNTIERTCRRCPCCGTPTERNGGCAHMHCIQCGEHWCFLCVRSWKEDCQWDHWFD
uniref:E3 ubiquitin-protein ligase parkin n=1 Tax=Setaria digitata TaxID=48799 RepID=A0A915PH85_9BILA